MCSQVRYLATVGGRKATELLTACVKKTLTAGLLKRFNMSGTNGKLAFKRTLLAEVLFGECHAICDRKKLYLYAAAQNMRVCCFKIARRFIGFILDTPGENYNGNISNCNKD
jgi:hypothetical protein